MGIANIATFDFFTQPDEANLVKSLEIARSLGIIDDMCRLTEVGKKINEFPIDPRLAVSLLKADGETFGCVAEMLTVAAMISNEPIFVNNKDGKLMVKLKKKIGAKEGDHLTLVNVYKFYRNQHSKHNQKRFINEFKINEKSLLNAIQLRENLEKIMKKLGYDTAKSDQDTENVLRCISTGFFTNAAQRTPDGSYLILSSKENVIMHPTSILNAIHPEWIIFHEVVMTGQSGKSFVRNCSEIDSSWLTELAPDYYQDKKAEIAQKRHLEEAQAIPAEIAGLGDPTKKLKQESIEFGGPVMKKIEKNRDALLKKPPVNRKIMISDMDFDQ